MKQMNIYLKSMIVIVGICLVMGTALAAVHMLTAPIIEANEQKKAQAALYDMFPNAEGFDLIFDAESRPLSAPSSINEMYTVRGSGDIVMTMQVSTGYSSAPLSFVVGFDASEKKVVALKVVSYNDSVYFGDDFPASFAGQDDGLTDVDSSASPAKITRNAVKQAVANAFTYLNSISWNPGGGPLMSPVELALTEIFPAAAGFSPVLGSSPRPVDMPEALREIYTVEGTDDLALVMRFPNQYDPARPSVMVAGIKGTDRTIIKLKIVEYNDSEYFGDAYVDSYTGKDSSLTDVDTTSSPCPNSREKVRAAVSASMAYMTEHGWSTDTVLRDSAMAGMFPTATGFTLQHGTGEIPSYLPSSVNEVYGVDGTDCLVMIMSISTQWGGGESTVFALGLNLSTQRIVGVSTISYADSIYYGDDFTDSFAGADSSFSDMDSAATPASQTRTVLWQAVNSVTLYLDTVEWQPGGTATRTEEQVVLQRLFGSSATFTDTEAAGLPAEIAKIYRVDGTDKLAAVLHLPNDYAPEYPSVVIAGFDSTTMKVTGIETLVYRDSMYYGHDFGDSFVGGGDGLTDIDSIASPVTGSKAKLKAAVQSAFDYLDTVNWFN